MMQLSQPSLPVERSTGRHARPRIRKKSGLKIVIIPADRSMASGHPINLGDAMLTDALVHKLGELGHAVQVIDFGDGDRNSSTPRLRVRGVAEAMRIIRSSDLALMGGGTLFQHEARGALRSGLPRLCFAMSAIARLAGTPLAFFGVGCDPVHDVVSATLLRLAVWRRSVWVRDRDSLARVAQTLGHTAALGADLSLLLYGSFAQPAPAGDVLVALNGNEAAQLRPSTVAAIARLGRPVFVNMHQRESDLDSSRIPREVSGALDVLEGPVEWRELAPYFERAKVVVASRMHALYYAALTNRPMIAVGSSAKVVAFAREFGVPVAKDVDSIDLLEPALADAIAMQTARARLDQALETVLGTTPASTVGRAASSPRKSERARVG